MSMLYNLSSEVCRFSKYMIKKNVEDFSTNFSRSAYSVSGAVAEIQCQQKRPKSPSCRSYILVSWGTAGEVTYSEQVT